MPGTEVLIDDRPIPYTRELWLPLLWFHLLALIAHGAAEIRVRTQMMHLEAEIRRLEAEFNMFFAGRLPRPPWETRARVAALVKKHDQSFIRNTADRFRFESLQNRYASSSSCGNGR